MKREKLISSLIAAALAFLLSFGGVGCLVTGFRMDGGSMVMLALACGFFSVVSAACFQLKWGGTLLLCLLALASGFLWHSKDAAEQLYSLLYRITYLYDRAYGWGVIRLGESGPGELTVGYPLGILGCLVAVCVSWTVCRRKNAIPAVLAALLPLFACLVVTDTVPKEGYLYILILGVLVLVLTNGQRRSSESQGNALALLAAAPTALALGLLFLAVPQKNYVNQVETLQNRILAWAEQFPALMEDLTEASQGNSIGDGETAQVDLRNTGPLIQRHYPVMEVVGAKSGTMYLRGQDYDLYDGTGWTAVAGRQEVLGGAGVGGILVERGNVTVTTNRSRDFFYIPYYTASGTALAGGRSANEGELLVYEFIQRTLPDNWQELVGTADDELLEYAFSSWYNDGGADERYLVLPNETRDWAEQLLDGILAGKETGTATDKAEAIADYVRNSAVYDTDTGKMPVEETDFVRWFLTGSSTGYCVHFASATAVLLRAAGVPARYVTGYMFQAEEDVAVTVQADQAHAWVEYYEPRLGLWIVLESTPADLEAEETTAPALTETEPSEDTAPVTEPEESEGPLPEPTSAVTIPADTGSGGGNEPAAEFRLPQWVKSLLAWLLWLGVAAAAVNWQRELRLRLRRKKLRSGCANSRALARWREVELLYRRLEKTPPEELEALAQKARFSQHSLTAEELLALDAGVRSARGACRQKPWYQRLIDRYIYAAY